MDVRIGVTHTPKEIEVELGSNSEVDQVVSSIAKALEDQNGVLWLTDKRGRRVGVPCSRVAYIEVGAGGEDRRVGFGTP